MPTYDTTVTLTSTGPKGDLPTLGLTAESDSTFIGASAKLEFDKVIPPGSFSSISMELGKTGQFGFESWVSIQYYGMTGAPFAYTDKNGIVYDGVFAAGDVLLVTQSAITPSLTVTPSLDGKTLTITDTTTGSPTVTSRNLEIYDPVGNLIDTIDMGGSLATTYDITQDQWIRFVLILNNGGYTATIDYLSEGFYYNALINQSKSGCGCNGNSLCSDTAKAMLSDKAALFYTTYGFAVNADTAIKAADTFII